MAGSQVKQQADEARKLIEGLNQPPAGEKQGDPQNAAPAEQKPKAAPAPDPVPTDDWKERYAHLRSSRDEKAGRLQSEIDDLRGRMDALARENEQLKTAPQTSAIPADLLTEDEIMMIGEENIGAITKLARYMADQSAAQLRPTIESVSANQKKDAEDRRNEALRSWNQQFLDRARKLVPDMDSIDASTDFKQWVDGLDDASGLSRREIAMSALKSGDVRRFASLYEEFSAASARQGDPRERLVNPQPTGVPSPKTDGTAGKHIWTRESIRQFYEDIRRKKLSADEAEAGKRDIYAAQVEGRIR